ncbi:MAG TPA: CDP-alcohol phosphatidyltransferase family protein [Mariniphaga sp.]|nr:CDP-alcohol phosphatidyltransferase family protein [Mariniphaga sp.]
MKIIVNNENVLNVPNFLSFYRLIIFPLILFFALTGRESLFVVFLVISLISDILDGSIARIFNLRTKFGAALDNLADIGTYILALLGLFTFKWTEIKPHAWFLFIFLALFIISYIIAFIRFGKIPGLHLYGAVTAGYMQGIFFFILFVWGFHEWMYFLAVGWGILAYTEKIFVLLKLDDIKFDVKGLYWLLKEQNRQNIGNRKELK